MKPSTASTILTGGLIPALLVTLLACPSTSVAQSADSDHIVSSQALQQQVESTSASRQKDIDTLTNLLSTPEGTRAMRDAHVDAAQVRSAIPTLSDQELTNLSARASHAQQDFAAGHIGPGLLTIIVLGIIVIIIVAIVH
jgi:hypothetical protein